MRSLPSATRMESLLKSQRRIGTWHRIILAAIGLILYFLLLSHLADFDAYFPGLQGWVRKIAVLLVVVTFVPLFNFVCWANEIRYSAYALVIVAASIYANLLSDIELSKLSSYFTILVPVVPILLFALSGKQKSISNR
jgi:NADH:ubiquinone oxidoreductase subunit 4 (subunit M)